MELIIAKKLIVFQKYIDYEFNNPELLYQALVTPHFGKEKEISHYEILETLGDAVIKLIFSLKIYFGGEEKPGQLTQIKQCLEDNKTFIKIGTQMGLLHFIFHSKNQRVKNTSIIADVFEAICGALYLDSGKNLELVEEKIVDRFFKDWKKYLKESTNLQKNELLEFLQNKLNMTPKVEYDYDKFGPDNRALWSAKNPKILDNSNNILIKLPSSLKSGKNKSKKEAEKELSVKILHYLKQSDY